MALGNPDSLCSDGGERDFGYDGAWGRALLPAASRGHRARPLHLPESLRRGQRAQPAPALRTSSGRCSAHRQPEGLLQLCPQQDPLPAGKTLGLGEMCDLLLTPFPFSSRSARR